MDDTFQRYIAAVDSTARSLILSPVDTTKPKSVLTYRAMRSGHTKKSSPSGNRRCSDWCSAARGIARKLAERWCPPHSVASGGSGLIMPGSRVRVPPLLLGINMCYPKQAKGRVNCDAPFLASKHQRARSARGRDSPFGSSRTGDAGRDSPFRSSRIADAERESPARRVAAKPPPASYLIRSAYAFGSTADPNSSAYTCVNSAPKSRICDE